MKYLPLIWAGLRRKPIRNAVTFLSVVVAFALFGLMIGLNAALDQLEARAHGDRIWSQARFPTTTMPVSLGRQIAQLPGIAKDSVMNFVPGYVGDPKTRAFILFIDNGYSDIFPDQVPPDQAALIQKDPGAVVINRSEANILHVKVGDRFTLISPQTTRGDGTKNWPMTVAGIFEDQPQWPGPFMAGNYDYFDKSMPAAEQGKIGEVDSLATDPDVAPALALRIDRLFANSGAPTRSQTEKQIWAGAFMDVNVPDLTRKIALIGLFMILLLAANVIAQSVRERRGEFATLKSLGFSTSGLVGLVMAEAALPCLLGAVCGVALASGLAGHIGDVMPAGSGIPAPRMTADVFLWAIGCALLLTLASTVLPILRLSRLDIAAALSRYA